MKPLCLALVLAQAVLEVPLGFSGTPEQALASIAELATAEPERAARIAAELATSSHPEPLRAEFRYAEGWLLAQGGAGGEPNHGAAAAAFASARALAGPGELRDAATYNQGTVELLLAEDLRARTLAQPPGAGVGDASDPLAELRQAYLRAKATLVARLRSQAAHADTRANLELVQRRLREIEELERQREEQQQEEQQQEDQEEDQGQEGEQEPQKGDPGEENQDQPPEEDPEGENPDASKEPGEGQPEDEQKPPGEDAAEPAAPEPAGERPGELPEPKPSAAPGAPAERVLSREEVLRLMDKLEALDEEAAALEALLRASRRVPVEKDW
jgi:hypothetical protein